MATTRSRDASLIATGFSMGVASMALFTYVRSKRRQQRAQSPSPSLLALACPPPSRLPPFARALMTTEDDKHPASRSLHQVRLREWEDLEWRAANGWTGRDYCHNVDSRAVRVLSYWYDDARHEMIGVVYFGPDAESHRGLCHGGAMSSLMDDFCGHMTFVSTDRPWSGATVQVNVSLKKPVRVGSVLRIVGRVSRREGRKVYVEALLDDGGGQGGNADEAVVYAALDGLSIDGVKMHEEEDAIAARTWEVGVCEQSGRPHRRDSSWNMKAMAS